MGQWSKMHFTSNNLYKQNNEWDVWKKSGEMIHKAEQFPWDMFNWGMFRKKYQSWWHGCSWKALYLHLLKWLNCDINKRPKAWWLSVILESDGGPSQPHSQSQLLCISWLTMTSVRVVTHQIRKCNVLNKQSKHPKLAAVITVIQKLLTVSY